MSKRRITLKNCPLTSIFVKVMANLRMICVLHCKTEYSCLSYPDNYLHFLSSLFVSHGINFAADINYGRS